MSETTFIYALCEPGTRTVRYIGKSNDLKRRLSEHLRRSAKVKTHLGNWLRSLLGAFPELIVLREVSGTGSEEEIKYIDLARRMGVRLVNSTDGGDGVTMTPEIRGKIGAKRRGRPGHPHSSETCAELSKAKIGPKNPNFGKTPLPETCTKISAALLGIRRSPETCAKVAKSRKGFCRAATGQYKRLPLFSDGGGI